MTEALEAGDDFTRATIPIRFAREMVAHVEDARAALRQAGIAQGALDHPGFRISGEQMGALADVLGRANDDELYGAFRRPVPRGTYATLVRMMTGYSTLRQTLDAANELYGLFDQHRPWTIEVSQGSCTLRLRPRTRAQRSSLLYNHTLLLTPWRTGMWLCKEHYPMQEVVLHQSFQAYEAESRYLFGLTPSYSDQASFKRFEASVLDLKVRRSAREATRWTRAGSFPAMIGRPPRGSLEGAVRAALAAATPVGALRLPQVARKLGMSHQTLSRHLREQGLSFRQLKDSLRRDVAISLLSRGHSVSAVSEALGFAEASPFQRAFKTWTGVTPGHYRP